MNRKKISLIIIVLIISTVAVFIFFYKRNLVGRSNLKKIENIKNGQTKKEVIDVMGIPKDTYSIVGYPTIYRYVSPIGASGDIEIYFDSLNQVSYIDKGQ